MIPNPQAATEPNVTKQELTRPMEQKAVPNLPTWQSEDAPQATKDPLTRLLDVMLGWAEYTEKDEAEHGDRVQAGDIYEAYSLMAEFAEPCWTQCTRGNIC